MSARHFDLETGLNANPEKGWGYAIHRYSVNFEYLGIERQQFGFSDEDAAEDAAVAYLNAEYGKHGWDC